MAVGTTSWQGWAAAVKSMRPGRGRQRRSEAGRPLVELLLYLEGSEGGRRVPCGE